MRIKKYTAKSMREALLQIKEELGEEAIILKTRKLPKKVFGIAGQDEIEVTAAVDDEAAKRQTVFPPLQMNDLGVYNRPRSSAKKPEPAMPSLSIPEKRSYRNEHVPANSTKSSVVPTEVAASGNTNEVDSKEEILALKENVKELKELVTSILHSAPRQSVSEGSEELSPGWEAVLKRLTDSEVKESLAKKLICSIQGENFLPEIDLEKKLVSALSSQFPVSGPLKLKRNAPIVVAFVGPTGAGKTTTLAKLAAHCCLNKGKRVSIITADTYRIAAIEQIRMFADIVKIGLQVVFSPEEIDGALKSCGNDEVVFVDTAGRSQRNSEHMEDLKNLISVLHPDETHLVLSATTKDSDLLENIRLYRSLGINRLLFTKLDETVRLGNIYNVVSESRIALSYFTFGQSVPDDIELAQPGKFVQRLMEGRTL
ncbi:Flagellar biosynthesis protein FlhF [Chitinispirillum alkaliphilum]|nr:Flagellar biosynthesis protein FlhF [Chitinispirillum alkaliphilum]